MVRQAKPSKENTADNSVPEDWIRKKVKSKNFLQWVFKTLILDEVLLMVYMTWQKMLSTCESLKLKLD